MVTPYVCPNCGEEGLSEEEIEKIITEGPDLCTECQEVICSTCESERMSGLCGDCADQHYPETEDWPCPSR